MKIIKKTWNTWWLVDSAGKMIDAFIGGPRTGYSSERGREFSTLAEIHRAYLLT